MKSFQIFGKFLWPETWHLRHRLHFWQWEQQYEQLHCDLWIQSDSIRNSCDVFYILDFWNTKISSVDGPSTPSTSGSLFVVEQYPSALSAYESLQCRDWRIFARQSLFLPNRITYQMCSKPLLVIYCWGQNIDLLN